MDPSTLLLSLIFGCFGMGFFMYGKNAGRLVPMIVGVALMISPYFIPNALVLGIVSVVLSVVPFFIRET